MRKQCHPEQSAGQPLSTRLLPPMTAAFGIVLSSELGTQSISELLSGHVPLGDPFYASWESDFYAPWSWLAWLVEYGNSADPCVRHVVRHETARILAGIAVSLLAGILLSRWTRRSTR